MIKTYKKLPVPTTSAWDRKSYDPILWLYGKIKNPENFDRVFDVYFVPKQFIVESYRSIKNIIRWIPTLWKDKDWDGYFIYEIMKKKLEHQRKELVGANRHTEVWRQNRDITICLNLIERLQNDYYEMEYLDYCENKHWFDLIEEKDDDGQNLYEMKSEMVEDNLFDFLNKYPLDVKKVLKSNDKKYDGYEDDYKIKSSLSLKVSLFRHEKAKKLLFKILSEKLEWWWD